MSDTAHKVAKALIEIGGVGFVPDKPITFKSGIFSPIYMDNRRFPFHPKQWGIVLEGFKQIIADRNIEFDVLAGIEAAGIPHSAGLGVIMQKPSVFVRKAVKDHGTKKMVEGGEVKGKRVLLVEDLVTTGGSSLSGVKELRQDGAIVQDCLVIVSYELSEATQAFEREMVRLHQLTSVGVILEVAEEMRKITKRDSQIVTEWLKNPREWSR